MRKTNTKVMLIIAFVLAFAALWAVMAFAATPGTGYCVNENLKQTNIKWTMDANGTLTFEIDANAAGKIATTELYGKDPVTGEENDWDSNLPTFADAVKVVVGDGITGIAGLSALKSLKEVELAPSVTKIAKCTFQSDASLSSVYIRGNSPVAGCFDFTNITFLGDYCCDGTSKLTALKLNPNYVGAIGREFFKRNQLAEVEIPAGVTEIKQGAFTSSLSLKVLTILGMETTIESDDVFKKNTTFPAIKAKTGSKAEEFAKANGYTFINLETGEKTQGTKATTGESSGASSGGTTAPTTELPPFNHDGATIWGHSTGKYNGDVIINTYWAYYKETKTLEFVSATTDYNETGAISNVDKEYTDWGEYKQEIEHIIVGDNIRKISGEAFINHTALKDVRLGKNVTMIDKNAFTGCKSLTTIWRVDNERVEGLADLSKMSKLVNNLIGTNVKELILPTKTTEIDVSLPTTIKNLWASTINDSMIEYAKANLFNLCNINNPEEKYEFWVYVDPDMPSCGGRAVFDFDEATGTLTIYGAGKIDDIVNYYGGGAKNQPWLSIKEKIKHIVITDQITSIGKYAFCELVNLETVEIPNVESFEILNAAFEKCHSLKSVYRRGTEPIEGTVDISNVHVLNSYAFAYDWLIANVIISPKVNKIGSSVFEENITLNLANIYGTPGSFAEKYASDNGLTFYDVSSNVPQPITCIPPETTASEKDTDKTPTPKDPDETQDLSTEDISSPETEYIPYSEPDPEFYDLDEVPESSSSMLPLIVAVVAAVIVSAALVVVIVSMRKRHNKE